MPGICKKSRNSATRRKRRERSPTPMATSHQPSKGTSTWRMETGIHATVRVTSTSAGLRWKGLRMPNQM